ncbi:diguanylate cyclase, partial [Pseudomonas sp.]|uniref:GGDEF domain-containing protein n=1 Tax=Pseudomonas sp. TaxID=306 RepID=UPI00345B2FCB
MIVGVEATHPSVALMATRLIESFKDAFLLPNGETAVVGASVGVASYPLHATNSKTLIHAADAAMYAVKQSGKGGFVIAQTSAASLDLTSEPDSGDSDASVSAQTERAASLGIKDRLRRDPLTGLMDRRQLVEQLTAAHTRVSAGAAPVAVICLDIDQFKLL